MANSKMEEYRIVKPIVRGNSTIPAGGKLQLVYPIDSNNATVYMDGGLMPPAYQNNFKRLVNEEKTNGWNCLRPLSPIKNRL